MIGSVGSGNVSTMIDASRGEPKPEATPKTVADHVVEADAQEPIPSVSQTIGTLVDTYL